MVSAGLSYLPKNQAAVIARHLPRVSLWGAVTSVRVKPIPAEGIKSNPSKRHRDRLNTELDRLASLLPFPQDVINKLDKLSVLRLSVSYLRAKSFFDVALKSSADRNGGQDNRRAWFRDGLDLQEGEFFLQALNGFVLAVTTDALVFYASSTIQDYLGFQQSDVIHQSVYEFIHTEDRAEFQHQLHWAFNSQDTDSGQAIHEPHGLSQPGVSYIPDQIPPENSSFMERCFICRLRCLLDNSSGFLAMKFQGRLKYLHGQNKKGKDGSILPPQLALFAIATPLQSPSILEIRTKNLIFRTKHKLDFTPIGCDAKAQIVLGYTEAELCSRGSGYQFVHAGDMLYCAESHIRMMKTGESGMTVFRLLLKHNRWAWIQSNARVVYKNGRPDYIIATVRALTDEEGREHLQKRNMSFPFMFTTGEAVLYETSNTFPPMMDPLPIRTKSSTSGQDSATKSTENKDSLHPSSLLAAVMPQDESIYHYPASNTAPFQTNFFNDSVIECSNWQENIVPLGCDNIPKHRQIGQSQEMNPVFSGSHAGPFPDNKNSELYSIMKNLGIDFEDIKRMQNEEFFRTDMSGEVDFRDIDIRDEILTYVQDSLSKSSFLSSEYEQQQAVTLNSSCMVQEQLELEQQQLQHHEKQIVVEAQQQLCQKMKHMQVNGLLRNWSSNPSMPFSCPQQDLQQYSVFPDLNGENPEFPCKSELDTMPYTQNIVPCDQSVLPQHSKCTQLEFPIGNFEPSLYPTTSNVEDFVTCLQVSENQRHGINLQSTIVTPQTCYTGAMSTYQCQPEPQHTHVDQMQYNPAIPGPQAFVNKNGGVLNDMYPAQLSNISNTQTATHLQPLHHPAETRPFPDLTPSGFL
ncbi:aryl hydrocarbon receptor isoform X1 [Heterocephalus glaber]|uniref:Aryl hydrocarbon receptor n=1 Tax=Heterocephalus glaber TaxID=10181 RepID=A0AAX6NYA5_HETGA|nr:aryl hydrocarbon receptor isoform X1 [Heterocephalus glaber]